MLLNVKGASEYAEWKVIKYLLWFWGTRQHIKVYGLENVDMNTSALFAVKHISHKDLPTVIHALPRRTVTFVTERLFSDPSETVLRNPVARHMLQAAGVVPLYVALREKPSFLPAIDYHAFRTFYETLKSGGWVAYAPEATPVPGAIGENIFPKMIMKAAERGHPTYLIGIRYGASIEVRIEGYNARDKPSSQVVKEVKEGFARLSGLEHKLAVPLLPPRNN